MQDKFCEHLGAEVDPRLKTEIQRFMRHSQNRHKDNRANTGSNRKSQRRRQNEILGRKNSEQSKNALGRRRQKRPDDPVYAASMFVNANSFDAPQIVDCGMRILDNPLDCGSGDYCYVMVNFYPYNTKMNRG
ncbi:MAG: DUF2815 family protein, partial [Synergistaceae bacterium]|nr:DUF2815 family protein [Synergistaceae bacterium]